MKLLICEGAGEIAFVIYLLKNLGYYILKEKNEFYKLAINKKFQENQIVEGLYLLNLDGHSNLEKFCDRLIKDSKYKELTHISFFVDAEDSYEATRLIYEEKLLYFKLISGEGLKTSIYISPDNKHDGKIEDLILETLTKQNVKNHIVETTIFELEKIKKEKIKNPSKASLMIYSATFDSLEGKIHTFISDIPEEINFESEKLLEIKEFLKNILS